MTAASGPTRLRVLETGELTGAEVEAILALMGEAFGSDPEEAFTADDWAHAVGGRHFVLDIAGEIVTHASVVERELHIDGRPLRTGYVEAVATAPIHDGRGYGSQVMEAVGAHIRDRYELGALGTGRHRFYERLGWETWRGQAYVRLSSGPRTHARRGGLHPGAAHAVVTAVRRHRSAQLRVATRRRLVTVWLD